ncbi:MAG: hypothetical protein EOP00_22070 [Pedobacter sp.]|nr:MAG: hypothetical protein EOP00_22070 [Pedobacter sp.]
MKKIVLALLMLFCVNATYAQEEKNRTDLDFLYQAIQQTPSYKDQLKGDKKYEQLYESLKRDLKSDNDFEIFKQLAKLIRPINDNHLGFSREVDSSYKFVSPIYKVDSLALINKYKSYPMDSLEGIYQSGKTKYVIQFANENEYQIVNLSTGELKGILYRTPHHSLDMVQFIPNYYAYTLTRNIKLQNNLLIGSSYYKGDAKVFYNILSRKEKYEYKVLEDQIGYLSLGTFNSTDKEIKAATDFFDAVKPTINVKHLIVDVRNNFGGGYKNSMQFIRFLRSFSGKIYILQNGYTVSNAEQFIINLKGLDNVVTLGESTRGTIAYGSNYGNTFELPSKRFSFYPTDMNGLKKEVAFESTGVEPKIKLDPFTENWVTQTFKYIKAND